MAACHRSLCPARDRISYQIGLRIAAPTAHGRNGVRAHLMRRSVPPRSVCCVSMRVCVRHGGVE
eukprot:4632665-Prymnesium_polylepis.1